MLANFFAILRDGEDTTCRRIRVARTVQQSLSEEFERQGVAFLTHRHRVRDEDGRAQSITEDSERIAFFPIYSIHDRRQVFELPGYSVDPTVRQAAEHPDAVEPLKLDDDTMPKLRALCASMKRGKAVKILFQGFERRRLIAKNRWTFLQDPTVFSRLDRPGFTLGDGIHAIYDSGTLLFRSFSVAARFLNLVDIFNEASDERVVEVLQHKVLRVEDADAILEHADSLMRKQFAAVAELGVLDKIDPAKAKGTAKDFDIDLAVVREKGATKIDFPTAKRDQKELLTFLTEGYYKGPLTGMAYESNSHRPKKTR